MRPLIVSGSAHPALAEDLARELECELASCIVRRFPDGEHDVEVQTSVRGQPVFVVQPLGHPVGEHVIELLLLADACRRAGARSVAAIAPYLGFARQDRVAKEGRPLGAKVLADVLGTGGFAQVIAVDLHSPVIASCVDAPVTHLTAVPVLVEAAVDALLDQGSRREVLVAATHGLFVGSATERLDRPEVARVVTSDSLPLPSRRPLRLEVVRLAPLLAEAVRRMLAERGLDDLLAVR